MIKHEEAKECISRLFDSYIYGDFIPFPTRSDLDTLSLYINQQEQLQAEHETLKKDVARYIELRSKGNGFLMENEEELKELWNLKEKLKKVGKEK